jgi:serine kinase of HPr protein (carbohydrate metabolism regulator)
MVTIHGTCVLLSEIGVLLRGESGRGKSDLALRLIDGGARLVSDDRVALRAASGRLTASAPPALAGLLEVRGVGILPVPSAASADVGLVVDLVPRDEVERLPQAETEMLMGITLPRLGLHAFDASTPAKIRLAAACLRDGRLERVPAGLSAQPGPNQTQPSPVAP